jgi:hypothetical protein
MPGSPAPNSFLEMSRSLLLYAPSLPILLAQQFIRDRYRRILEIRPWSALRAESEFLIYAAKTAGSVAVVRGSDQVVGTLTAFTLTDIGRQFKASAGSPIYTITNVVVISQTLTLDRVFGGDSAVSASYYVFDGYVTPPSDFMMFMVVTDPRNAWRLQHWVTQDELNRWDPQRTFFGTAYALIDRRFNSVTNTPQYELWPYNTTDRNYPYFYSKRGADLVNPTDIPVWPIRSDIIVYGALADLCLWPGTPDVPNPLFASPYANRSLSMFEGKYQDGLIELERRDEEIYMTWLSSMPAGGYPFSPLSAGFMQSHVI